MNILDSINVLGLAEHPEHLETILGWYLQEWPQVGSKQTLTRRLFGAGVSGKLPLALVAMSDLRPVGFISLVFHEKGMPTGRLHWVDALYTHPPFRRRGIASFLLRIGEQRAMELGITDLYALTDEVALYRQMGWTPVRETKPESLRDVVMHKQLRAWEPTDLAIQPRSSSDMNC